jgi:hypothetical protein
LVFVGQTGIVCQRKADHKIGDAARKGRLPWNILTMFELAITKYSQKSNGLFLSAVCEIDYIFSDVSAVLVNIFVAKLTMTWCYN